MSPIKLEIVTAEQSVYSEDVNMVTAPGIEGQLGILSHHTPLMTILQAGELRIKKGEEEISMAVSGGFLEVRPDRVVILADTAERAENIDLARAEEAKKRAGRRLTEERATGLDASRTEASLRRALVRLQVLEKTTKRRRRS
ncbi:F0F1 ATP synthase subunit epsilon [Chloroflexota bacterium]